MNGGSFNDFCSFFGAFFRPPGSSIVEFVPSRPFNNPSESCRNVAEDYKSVWKHQETALVVLECSIRSDTVSLCRNWMFHIPIGSMGLLYLPTFGWFLWFSCRWNIQSSHRSGEISSPCHPTTFRFPLTCTFLLVEGRGGTAIRWSGRSCLLRSGHSHGWGAHPGLMFLKVCLCICYYIYIFTHIFVGFCGVKHGFHVLQTPRCLQIDQIQNSKSGESRTFFAGKGFI